VSSCIVPTEAAQPPKKPVSKEPSKRASSHAAKVKQHSPQAALLLAPSTRSLQSASLVPTHVNFPLSLRQMCCAAGWAARYALGWQAGLALKSNPPS